MDRGGGLDIIVDGGESSVLAGLVLCDSGQVSGCGFGDFGSQLDGDGGGASQQRGNYLK